MMEHPPNKIRERHADVLVVRGVGWDQCFGQEAQNKSNGSYLHARPKAASFMFGPCFNLEGHEISLPVICDQCAYLFIQKVVFWKTLFQQIHVSVHHGLKEH